MMMQRVASMWLPFLVTFSARATPKFPLPPLQTPVQIEIHNRKNTEAQVASDAATPHVLEFFGSQGFRHAIQDCCPEAAATEPEELLRQFREEVRAAEYAHAFPVRKSSPHALGTHFNIKLGEEYKFLLNSYQAMLNADEENHDGPGRPENVTNFTNVGALAEEMIFGFPPFRHKSIPTWAEASDRMNYVAQNMRRVNFGSSPAFGDATIIFNNDYIKDMILTAPLDTGLYEMVCNRSVTVPFELPFGFNCLAWSAPLTLATWEHFDHIIMTNLAIWRLHFNSGGTSQTSIYDEARSFFDRSPFSGSYSKVRNMTGWDLMKYWETNVVGNVRFPEGVRFLIGAFQPLFGSAAGRALQKFAQTFGWPLVWAFTDFVEETSKSLPTGQTFALKERALDPTMKGSLALNATFPMGAAKAFETLWSSVATERANASKGQWLQWWRSLVSQQIPLAPSTARSCGSFQSCIGSDTRTGVCLCKNVAASLTTVVV